MKGIKTDFKLIQKILSKLKNIDKKNDKIGLS